MNTQEPTPNAAGGASALTDGLGGEQLDIVARLRDTPNWLREPWSVSWKDLTHKYDRAPFEAADEIERLRALLRRGLRRLEAWQEFYGRHCNGPTMGNVLPPAGDVQWAEAVSEALTTPNVK